MWRRTGLRKRSASTSTSFVACTKRTLSSMSTAPRRVGVATPRWSGRSFASCRRRSGTRSSIPARARSSSVWRRPTIAWPRRLATTARASSQTARWRSATSALYRCASGWTRSAATFASTRRRERERRCHWRWSLADEIRVLIADDHAVVRNGLRAFLDVVPDIDVVGEAENGAEALERVRQLQPDVVVMDMVMPELDGVAATKALRETSPNVHVLALSSFTDDERVLPALGAGAVGFLTKGTSPPE